MAVDIRASLKKFIPHLLKAQEENLNEADTVQRLIKFFEDVLGYNALSEITRESQIKDKYVDIAVRINNAVRLLVEVKAAGVVLRDRHIEQAERYAADGNIKWVLLTNGIEWNLFHLTFEEGIESTKVFTVNITTDTIDKTAHLLGYIHKQSIVKGDLEDYWQKTAALHPGSIGKAIFTEDVLRFIRREIRKKEGIMIDEEDLAKAIHEMFSAETREQIGPMKIRRKRKIKETKQPEEEKKEQVIVDANKSPDENQNKV